MNSALMKLSLGHLNDTVPERNVDHKNIFFGVVLFEMLLDHGVLAAIFIKIGVGGRLKVSFVT